MITYLEWQKEFCGPNAWLEWFSEPVLTGMVCDVQLRVSLKSMKELGFFEVFFLNSWKTIINE